MAIGEYRHVVQFQTPTTAPDGDGGVIETWVDLLPRWPVAIQPATVHDLERQSSGTTVATATHIVRGRYRPDVTVESRMLFNGRTFKISGVANPKERNLELWLFAVETV
jgi:SPP1 family predicted phage head-tail adaptor